MRLETRVGRSLAASIVSLFVAVGAALAAGVPTSSSTSPAAASSG